MGSSSRAVVAALVFCFSSAHACPAGSLVECMILCQPVATVGDDVFRSCTERCADQCVGSDAAARRRLQQDAPDEHPARSQCLSTKVVELSEQVGELKEEIASGGGGGNSCYEMKSIPNVETSSLSDTSILEAINGECQAPADTNFQYKYTRKPGTPGTFNSNGEWQAGDNGSNGKWIQWTTRQTDTYHNFSCTAGCAAEGLQCDGGMLREWATKDDNTDLIKNIAGITDWRCSEFRKQGDPHPANPKSYAKGYCDAGPNNAKSDQEACDANPGSSDGKGDGDVGNPQSWVRFCYCAEMDTSTVGLIGISAGTASHHQFAASPVAFPGEFEFSFALSASWGWAGVHLAAAELFHSDTGAFMHMRDVCANLHDVDWVGDLSKKKVSLMMNSSNNMAYISWRDDLHDEYLTEVYKGCKLPCVGCDFGSCSSINSHHWTLKRDAANIVTLYYGPCGNKAALGQECDLCCMPVLRFPNTVEGPVRYVADIQMNHSGDKGDVYVKDLYAAYKVPCACDPTEDPSCQG